MFGYPVTPAQPVPAEKDMFGNPITPAPPVVASEPPPVVAPQPDPVEKDMFGYPVTPVPPALNQNTNRKETNIVLKPLSLQPVNRPENVWNNTLPAPAPAPAPMPPPAPAPMPAAMPPPAAMPAAMPPPAAMPAPNKANENKSQERRYNSATYDNSYDRSPKPDNKKETRNMFGEVRG